MLEHAQHVTKRETNFRKRYDRVKSCTNIYDTCSVFVPIVSTIMHVSVAFLPEKCYAKNASSAWNFNDTRQNFLKIYLNEYVKLSSLLPITRQLTPLGIFPFKMK